MSSHISSAPALLNCWTDGSGQLAAAHCLHLACKHLPNQTCCWVFQPGSCVFFPRWLTVHMASRYLDGEAVKMCLGEEVSSVFFNRHSWCLSNFSPVPGLWASLGVATLWIIALNTGWTEGGYNKAALYCRLQLCVCVHYSALHSLT